MHAMSPPVLAGPSGPNTTAAAVFAARDTLRQSFATPSGRRWAKVGADQR